MASESPFLRFHGTWTMIKRFTHTAQGDALHTSLREQLLSRKAPATAGHIRPLWKVWTVHSYHGQQGTICLLPRFLSHSSGGDTGLLAFILHLRPATSILRIIGGGQAHATAHVWKSKDTFTEFFFPPLHGSQGLNLGCQVCVAGTSTYWAIWPALNFIFETMSLYEAQAGLKLDLASWVMKMSSCLAYWTLFSFFFLNFFFLR